jgi:hypothetical protein
VTGTLAPTLPASADAVAASGSGSLTNTACAQQPLPSQQPWHQPLGADGGVHGVPSHGTQMDGSSLPGAAAMAGSPQLGDPRETACDLHDGAAAAAEAAAARCSDSSADERLHSQLLHRTPTQLLKSGEQACAAASMHATWCTAHVSV